MQCRKEPRLSLSFLHLLKVGLISGVVVIVELVLFSM